MALEFHHPYAAFASVLRINPALVNRVGKDVGALEYYPKTRARALVSLRQAVQHLVALLHERIAFIKDPLSLSLQLPARTPPRGLWRRSGLP